jgi:3'(2'), 5'-bisphosphate nucleotidase
MINRVIEVAEQASIEIMKIYRKNNFNIKNKEDSSPVTEADIAANQIITDGLKNISEYPIVSEEAPVDYKVRKEWGKFWLVDPLDGTKDFIVKNGEFTVNIALIENRKPVLGVVYLPAHNDIYYAAYGQGAYKNGVKIFNNSNREKLIASDSNFHSTGEVKIFFDKHNIIEVKKYGSSLKICKLAEGLIDVYPRLNGTKEWDTAASHILANEAGCKLIDIKTKKELIYNKKDINNNFFIASRDNLEFNL